MKKIIGKTKSVCPVCLADLDAFKVVKSDGIYLEKNCEAHGFFSTLIWESNEKSYNAWNTASVKKDKLTDPKPEHGGCPYDCGLCENHIRAGCCVLLELTSRCNLHCPVCFASAGESDDTDPTLDDISQIMDMLMAHGGPFNLQLSGGEPTMRDDLPDIIRLGISKGFSFFQLNTNGIRLSQDAEYAQSLKNAGLSTVFLQFDGLSDRTYKTLRGRPLLLSKLSAIKNCAKAGLGVVLVPVIAPGINDNEIGSIIKFALKNMPSVRGVHFQPISYFGRCIDISGKRITIPYMLKEIENQTNHILKSSDFRGGAAENPYCSFHASYIKQKNGLLKLIPQKTGCCCGGSPSKQSQKIVARQWSGTDEKSYSAGSLDAFIKETHNNSFSVSGMLFQDAFNLDLDRLQKCYICEADPKYGMVPFCAYNLTSVHGKSLYRNE